ncbi:MAG: hypothetical protein HXS46_03405 [Theionarchaea archaeon]|nr:hypothetical protein [Theionarchaea archaeon]
MKADKNNLSSKQRSSLEKKYKGKIVEELELGPYISYKSNKDIPFLHVYRFEEAFSFRLIWEILNRFKANKDDYVFDPFCGSGTTLFTSFVKGIPSVGTDTLPLALFVSETLPQFLFLEKGEITNVWKKLLFEIDSCHPASVAADVPIMKVAFNKDILLKLRKMKTAIENLPARYTDIFLFLFFSILEECSLTVKENRYPKVVEKKSSDPFDAMKERIRTVEEDITVRRYQLNRENLPEVFSADTRELLLPFKKKPTILITSPPYADQIDYTQSYALELCFHFVENVQEFNNLRERFLRSYTGPVMKEESPHPAVEEVVSALKNSDSGIPEMVNAYFVDMKRVIKEWYSTLSKNARIAVIVDNLIYHGEIIPADLILSDMAGEIGFATERIVVAKYKKNLDNIPVRESVIMWKQ